MVKERLIIFTTRYKKGYKRMKKRGENIAILNKLIQRLGKGKLLPKDRDHALKGEFFGLRECHVKGDWVIVYEENKDEVVLRRTGTHSDIFKKRY